MSVIVAIPARFASTRYPGKPLVMLKGARGAARSLIRRSWDAACGVAGVDRIVVATDDARIAEHAQGFGAEVVMTSERCRNGTERCGEVAAQIAKEEDIIVNLQGDAPLTPPWFVEGLIDALKEPDVTVATPVLRTDAQALRSFKEDRANGRVGGTTAVFNTKGDGLYFSKEVLPYTGRDFAAEELTPVWHHVGVYAYRPAALRLYTSWGEGQLEQWEGLEQLRFLENGISVRCVPVEAQGRAFWELNNPVDVARIEAILQAQGID